MINIYKVASALEAHQPIQFYCSPSIFKIEKGESGSLLIMTLVDDEPEFVSHSHGKSKYTTGNQSMNIEYASSTFSRHSLVSQRMALQAKTHPYAPDPKVGTI